MAEQAHIHFEFEAIGTHWAIDLYDNLPAPKVSQLETAIYQRIELFDQAYSRFRSDSLVTKMSKHPGRYTLPNDADVMLRLYYDLYHLTGGLFTPLIAQVLIDAGYDAEYSLTQKRPLVAPPTWDDAIAYTNLELELKLPELLDFGAAGKGYLIDLVGEVLTQAGVEGYCVDAGGDLLHRSRSSDPLRVGLENPANIEQIIGVCSLSNRSLCGSAGNRRTWRNFHHIINPQTLSSPRQLLATWVLADTTILADALSTCLFFVPAAQLANKYSFEYATLDSDFAVQKSQGFPAEFFTI